MTTNHDIIESLREKRDEIFEMANFTKERSGLPANLWFDEVGKDRINKHNDPRLKVQGDNKTDLIPVSISKTPKILLKGNLLAKAIKKHSESEWDIIFKFIVDNYDLIMSQWNGDIDGYELISRLMKK